MQKKYFFLSLLFFFTLSIAYCQSSIENQANKDFINSLHSSGLTEDTIDKIKILLEEKSKRDLDNKKLQSELEINYPIQFRDDEINLEYSNKKFLQSISQIITVEQFEKIFLPQLEYRIKKISDEKWNLSKGKYKLSKDQEKKYRNLLYENTKNEIIIRSYYSYDDNLSWNTYTEEKIKSFDKERELLKNYGLFFSKDNKTDVLIKNLQTAKIDNQKIDLILKAIQTEQERQDKREKTWRENQAYYVVQFHDEGDVEDKIRMDLRQQICTILSYDEFKTIFIKQMQNRILRETKKEFEVIKNAYQFTDQQNKTVQDLVFEKNTEKIATEEYYKYNWDLSQQKLRAVEFRQEKKIRDAIQKFNTVKS